MKLAKYLVFTLVTILTVASTISIIPGTSAFGPPAPRAVSSSSATAFIASCNVYYTINPAVYLYACDASGSRTGDRQGPMPQIEADNTIQNAISKGLPEPDLDYGAVLIETLPDGSTKETIMPWADAESIEAGDVNRYNVEILFYIIKRTDIILSPTDKQVTVEKLGPFRQSQVIQSISDDWNQTTANPPTQCQDAAMSMQQLP